MKNKIAHAALAALMAAVIAVCAWITVPAAVPFTLQTFGVFLALMMLGGAGGSAAVLLYILIGALGLPVFSGFRGGPGVIIGPTGGYIIGFVFICGAYLAAEKFAGSAARNKKRRFPLFETAALAAGLILCYAAGTIQFAIVSRAGGNAPGILSILSMCVFPFIVPDAVKLIAAAFTAQRIKAILPKISKTVDSH